MCFRSKHIHSDAFRPFVHTNTLSVYIDNPSIWKHTWQRIKTKFIHVGLVQAVENASKWKRCPKVSQARLFVACAESSTYVTTRDAIVFLRFCLDSRKRIKSVVWTRIDLCVFDDNESEYFWKHMSVDKALGSMGQCRVVKIYDLATRLWDI